MADLTKRIMAIAVCAALTLAACSGGDVEPLEEGLDTETSETSTTTTTTASSTTTTTEATTTTLSELEIAEAEIISVVTEFWQFPIDSRKGEEGTALEQTTGLLNRRLRDSLPLLESEGRILFNPDPGPIEFTEVTIDLEAGTAVANACISSTSELLDAETLEVLVKADPADTAEAVYQMQLVDDEWLISEFLTPTDEIGVADCEIDA